MRRSVAILTVVISFGLTVTGLADFKYSEQSKVTGGMMAGMMKFAGAFSRKANQPVTTTHYVKGNRLRTDNGTENTAEIIDLDGRRMIHIDNQKRSYSILTFDQMKAALEEMQRRMKATQEQKNVQMNLTPKVEVTSTQNTRAILGQTAREVKVKMEMEMQATDTEKHQSGSGSMTFVTDQWVAPSVPGYGEVRDFYKRMALSINWVPTGGLFNMNPQMAKGMEELKKNSTALEGLPMLQYISMYMGGMTGQPGTMGQPNQSAQPDSSQQPNQQSSAQAETQPSKPATPGSAISQGVGNMLGGFGGFGRKKKKQQDQQQQDTSQNTSQAASQNSAPASNSAQTPPAPASSGSFMDMTVEVTAFSSDSLSGDLFDIPAGYKQVEADAEKALSGSRR